LAGSGKLWLHSCVSAPCTQHKEPKPVLEKRADRVHAPLFAEREEALGAPRVRAVNQHGSLIFNLWWLKAIF